VHNLHAAWDNQVIWLSIIGLGVFWGISQVLLAAFPAYAKDSLGEINTVVIQGVMAFAGIGIIIGAAVAGRISRDHVETGLIPFSALGIALVLLLLPGIGSIWLHGLNFFALGVLAGIFIVPLNALIQFNAGERELGRVLAAKNFVLNWIMLGALIVTVISALADTGSRAIMVALAIVAFAGAIYTVWQLPQSLVRFLIARIIATRYRLQVIGLNNMPAQGGVLMLGNHISWIDWAMVQMASPRPVRFVMERVIYERWYLRWFLDFFGVVPISRGQSRHALEAVTDLLNDGEVVCLFPEGTLSKNAQLSEFKKGFELAAKDADGVILPFYLRGLWGSRFSNASDKLKESRRDGRARDVIVAFGPTLPIHSHAQRVKQAVFELSVSSWQEHVQTLPTLPSAWLTTPSATRHAGGVRLHRHGADQPQADRRGAVVRRRHSTPRARSATWASCCRPAAPASSPTWPAGWPARPWSTSTTPQAPRPSAPRSRTPASQRHHRRALHCASSRRAASTPRPCSPARGCMRWRTSARASARPAGCSASAPPCCCRRPGCRGCFASTGMPDDTAAILFSSGSEGTPKGVELTHRNIIANVRQISDVLNTERDDLMLSNLPLFHAFGLTATTCLPLLEGIPMVCHPDPTDALGSAKAIARWRATVLCSTSTFLRLYVRNRKVHPIMLESLRIVVAGAERLSPDVREAFALKFNKTIYEGYGATETTPVASVNVPDAIETDNWKIQTGSKPGTVGMPLPGTSFRIVDPVTLETLPTGEDGLILIGGVQVMKGYLNDPERTADAVVELDGQRWYKTGDKGHQDADGFLTIVDRYSRFAKLGGEMVSLGAVEQQVRDVLKAPELELCAVNLPDAKKGERIVLLIEPGQPGRRRPARRLIAAGSNPLMIPAEILTRGCSAQARQRQDRLRRRQAAPRRGDSRPARPVRRSTDRKIQTPCGDAPGTPRHLPLGRRRPRQDLPNGSVP
jgi:acyl-[acyl-carrier-protein]-phospholipid O-acyltransferase/long-chain-fatty-acid--[acyl-carrier-protein] ligase